MRVVGGGIDLHDGHGQDVAGVGSVGLPGGREGVNRRFRVRD